MKLRSIALSAAGLSAMSTAMLSAPAAGAEISTLTSAAPAVVTSGLPSCGGWLQAACEYVRDRVPEIPPDDGGGVTFHDVSTDRTREDTTYVDDESDRDLCEADDVECEGEEWE